MGVLATTAMGYVASQRSKRREGHADKDVTVKGEAGTESLAAAILATAAETEDEKQQALRNESNASVGKEAPEGLGMTEVVLASTILLGVIAVSNVGVTIRGYRPPTLPRSNHATTCEGTADSCAYQVLMTINHR
jgi:hypothetical protein